MLAFKTRNDLVEAYAKWLQNADGYTFRQDYQDSVQALDAARAYARTHLAYLPRIYNGGWLALDFGYSCERFSLLRHAGHLKDAHDLIDQNRACIAALYPDFRFVLEGEHP